MVLGDRENSQSSAETAGRINASMQSSKSDSGIGGTVAENLTLISIFIFVSNN